MAAVMAPAPAMKKSQVRKSQRPWPAMEVNAPPTPVRKRATKAMEKRKVHHPTKTRKRTDPVMDDDCELPLELKSDVSVEAMTATMNDTKASVMNAIGWLCGGFRVSRAALANAALAPATTHPRRMWADVSTMAAGGFVCWAAARGVSARQDDGEAWGATHKGGWVGVSRRVSGAR